MQLLQRNPIAPWPFRASFGVCMQDGAIHSAKGGGSVGRRQPALQASGGFTAGSRAGPAQGQSLLCTCALLVLVLTTPSNTGRLQAELKTQPSRIWPSCHQLQDPTHCLLELEAVSPDPGKFQHSQKYRAVKPWGPGKPGEPEVPPLLHRVSFSLPTNTHILRALKSLEQGLCRWSSPRLTAPRHQPGKESLGALTGEYVGHHLGTTVKDRTRQGSVPNTQVQGSETLHMLPFHPAPAHQNQHRSVQTGQKAPDNLNLPQQHVAGWKTLVHALQVDLPAGGSSSGLGAPIQGFQQHGAVLLMVRSCVMPLKGC